jgi:hypothetical protein
MDLRKIGLALAFEASPQICAFKKKKKTIFSLLKEGKKCLRDFKKA